MVINGLKNKTILITGSSEGIGKAIAKLCIKEEANVIIHGHEKSLVKAVEKEFGKKVISFTADLSKANEVKNLIDQCLTEVGQLDVLVNNAAAVLRDDLDSITTKQFDYIIAVNLKAPLFLIKHLVPHFKQIGGGVILNIGSVNAYCGEPNQLAYSISKGGLMTLTRNLGNVLSKYKIRVNQINVGWTLTNNEIKRKIEDGLHEGWEKRLSAYDAPWGRLISPGEVAKHALFWMSDASVPATGAVYDLEQYPLIGRTIPPEDVC